MSKNNFYLGHGKNINLVKLSYWYISSNNTISNFIYKKEKKKHNSVSGPVQA